MEHFDPWSREAIHHTSRHLNTSFMVADDTEAAELHSEGLAFRQYLSHLSASPDCRDPDHPGCARCAQPDPEHDAAAMRVLRGAL